MKGKNIPFNWPHMTGKELYYIAEAHFNGKLAGDGPYTAKCHAWLQERTASHKVLLTHSCTAALEMAALLLDIQPGDEIIMPSYTFVSTANAFVLRGGIPVFVDIREDTLNLDERLIEQAITSRTRAIVPVHYAGVACEMDAILAIARQHGLHVVEDAAQGVMSTYKGRALGAIGDLGAYSFHETKNVISGEGGALLVNQPALAQRAEIIREKGTDRSRFFRGEVDKYTWQEVGSSFLPGELIAAFLWAQLEGADAITDARLAAWHRYDEQLAQAEQDGLLRRPVVPDGCVHNAHMYYVIVPQAGQRQQVLDALKQEGIGAVFHYVPLHSSPAGLRYGRVSGAMDITDLQSERLIRLPLWAGLTVQQQDKVIDILTSTLKASRT
ncbi:dTDP-4-amino-4,6-dideoxygalactose transaminase [Herbaspirillum huttiense]|uniref:dTDP-4-amino-4,6-dideoxygalactose transaminase n=1 Tax=Herbaspirillum huttiense TaxID=863372 RepID=UPI0005849855|nr:dTDP-4-amino-4,6-dideoxygalactose transaminase [Herbaspirillum huttiense]MBN9355087.1 dTDP-4-amino-4,6-dideoxygalactose transaminase [Herbaspirillum huttiense]